MRNDKLKKELLRIRKENRNMSPLDVMIKALEAMGENPKGIQHSFRIKKGISSSKLNN